MIVQYTEETKALDMIQTGGPTTHWPVRIDGGTVPVAAFNSEHSALEFCLRAWAEELGQELNAKMRI